MSYKNRKEKEQAEIKREIKKPEKMFRIFKYKDGQPKLRR